MPTHQEVDFMTTSEPSHQIPAVEQRNLSRNPVREQEHSVEDLRAAVESLQQTVCELLLRNQRLRMALDREREIAPTGFPSSQS